MGKFVDRVIIPFLMVCVGFLILAMARMIWLDSKDCAAPTPIEWHKTYAPKMREAAAEHLAP